MLNHIDFAFSTSIFISIASCLLFPVFLFFASRLESYQEKNASQFLICTIITLMSWLCGLILTKSIFFSSIELALTNIFILICALLIYLEIWGLLSRGYTIGLLLTFYKAKKPLNIQELGKCYRSGRGLEWLIEHRFAGLTTADMLRREGDKVTLTYKGTIIVFIYQLFIRLFGLRYTG